MSWRKLTSKVSVHRGRMKGLKCEEASSCGIPYFKLFTKFTAKVYLLFVVTRGKEIHFTLKSHAVQMDVRWEIFYPDFLRSTMLIHCRKLNSIVQIYSTTLPFIAHSHCLCTPIIDFSTPYFFCFLFFRDIFFLYIL